MDTLKEIQSEKYISKHLLMCGTCKYKRKGRCINADSDCYEEVVVDECSCNEYVPQKGLHVV